MPRPSGLPQPSGQKDVSQFQQTVGRITNNPRFAEVLKELDSDAQARNDAQRDPKGYFKKKGIQLPDNADVEFVPGSIYVRICCFGFCLIFYDQ